MLVTTFEKLKSLWLHSNGCHIIWDAYYCMGRAHKRAMWLLQRKWVPIFLKCLFSMGTYHQDFTVDDYFPLAFLFPW